MAEKQVAHKDPYGFIHLGRMIDKIGGLLPSEAERIAALRSIIDDLAKLAAELEQVMRSRLH
jgi:hypothetical protein